MIGADGGLLGFHNLQIVTDNTDQFKSIVPIDRDTVQLRYGRLALGRETLGLVPVGECLNKSCQLVERNLIRAIVSHEVPVSFQNPV